MNKLLVKFGKILLTVVMYRIAGLLVNIVIKKIKKWIQIIKIVRQIRKQKTGVVEVR